MAALLRNTARLTRSALQLQQRRHVGDLPVKPNKYIEQWAARRELVEEEFKWDAKTITQVVTFGLLVPYAIYAVMCVGRGFGAGPGRGGVQRGGSKGPRHWAGDCRPCTAAPRLTVGSEGLGSLLGSHATPPCARCSVKEYERVDDRAGRPRRQVWGGEA